MRSRYMLNTEPTANKPSSWVTLNHEDVSKVIASIMTTFLIAQKYVMFEIKKTLTFSNDVICLKLE